MGFPSLSKIVEEFTVQGSRFTVKHLLLFCELSTVNGFLDYYDQV